jgi:hypothetical protein
MFGFLVFPCLPIMTASANVALHAPSCAAPKEYLTDLARFADTIKVEQDFSCLTDLPSITSRLSQYQLIDLRSVGMLDNAWKLSINELKLKSYLSDRKLLLLDDRFSRVKAAANCALLKKSGFTQTKILLGGAELWQEYKNNHKPNHESKFVTAKDFMYEYFNGSVLVVTANKDIAKTLMLLGIDKVTILQSNDTLSDLIINKSLNGYLPVVLVDEPYKSNNLLTRYSNLFALEGGITALENQFKIDVMTDLSRFDTLGVSACEAL